MKKVNQILSVLMAMIFIVSTTGILVYKTHCSCTGTKQVGIYVQPETCVEDFHVHHTHDFAGNEQKTKEKCCHECSAETHDCGCASPDVRFFKLTNEITQDDVSYDRAPDIKIAKIVLTVLEIITSNVNYNDTGISYSDGPPKVRSSKNFLIQLNQLKIPFSA